MSTTTCASCQAETTNGLALCDLCQIRAARCLELIPTYFANLARWRPGNAGTRGVPGSREPRRAGSGGVDRVGLALDAANNALSTWARVLADDRLDGEIPASGNEAGSVKVACWLLTSHLTSIATTDWCGTMVDDVTTHEAVLRTLTEQVAPGWYAGTCSSDTCDHATYVVPGLTWLTCRGCGRTTHAGDHLGTILDEARGWLARPRWLAEAIVVLVDTEDSVPKLQDRIRAWASRGRLDGVQATALEYVYDEETQAPTLATVPVGQPRYRLGDVLDLIRRHEPAKPAEVSRAG